MDLQGFLALFERLGTLVQAEQRRILGEHGLQPVHGQILAYLARCNRFSDTPAAVSDYLNSTRGTVSQSLQVLEREGLLEKNADSRDGRVVHLKLTRRGKRLADQLALYRSFGGLDAEGAREDLEAAGEILRTFLLSLQMANSLRSFGVCRDCRHLQEEENGRRLCGITGLRLRMTDLDRICHDHEHNPDETDYTPHHGHDI